MRMSTGELHQATSFAATKDAKLTGFTGHQRTEGRQDVRVAPAGAYEPCCDALLKWLGNSLERSRDSRQPTCSLSMQGRERMSGGKRAA